MIWRRNYGRFGVSKFARKSFCSWLPYWNLILKFDRGIPTAHWPNLFIWTKFQDFRHVLKLCVGVQTRCQFQRCSKWYGKQFDDGRAQFHVFWKYKRAQQIKKRTLTMANLHFSRFGGNGRLTLARVKFRPPPVRPPARPPARFKVFQKYKNKFWCWGVIEAKLNNSFQKHQL